LDRSILALLLHQIIPTIRQHTLLDRLHKSRNCIHREIFCHGFFTD